MEGVFAWTGANYAAGMLQESSRMHGQHGLHGQHARRSLGDDSSSSAASVAASSASGGRFHGIMELGGASFQITFLPLAPLTTGSTEAMERNGEGAVVKLPGVWDRL